MPMLSCVHCPYLRNALVTSSRLHVAIGVLMFLITVLVTLVAANVEGTNKPLFEKHGINMWSFLVALGVYCFALVAADTNSPNHEANSSRINSLIAVIFGLLSAVSLISTLVPQVIGYVILSISWTCAAIIVVVYEDGKLYKGACHWIYNYIMKLVLTNIRNNNWFHEASNNNMVISSHSTEQPPGAISDIV